MRVCEHYLFSCRRDDDVTSGDIVMKNESWTAWMISILSMDVDSDVQIYVYSTMPSFISYLILTTDVDWM